MADNIIIIPSTSTIDAGQSIIEFCLPERIECCPTPKDGHYADTPWNCENFKCGTDRKYFIPYKKGDKIQFQTLAFGGSPGNPASYDSLVNVEICLPDQTTVPISGRKMSAYKNGRPYQIIEIDTSGITFSCWNLKFTIDGEICYSQQYKEMPCRENEYLSIRSIVEFEDCFKFCYGEPDKHVGDLIEYDNTMRIRAVMRSTQFSVPKAKNELTGEEYIDNSVVNAYIIRMMGKFAPFMKNILSKQLLSGKTVIINGKEYKTGAVSSSNEISECTNMWRSTFTVYEECMTSSQGSNLCL